MRGGAKMLQYKLYRIFEQDKDNTLSKLYSIFGENKVIKLNENLIAIEYSENNLTQKEVINKVRPLNASQFIITCNYFIKIIDYCINRNYLINEIRFMDSIILEDEDIIKRYLSEINYTNREQDKKIAIKRLYSELNWISKEESIDIQQVVIMYKTKNKDIFKSIIINNNGIVVVKDNSCQILESIMGECMSEEI